MQISCWWTKIVIATATSCTAVCKAFFFSLFHRFNCISIAEEGCGALTSAFNSNPSNLIELDLSGNKLGNSGVTEISTLLGNSQCSLQILRFELGEFRHEQKIYIGTCCIFWAQTIINIIF